MQSASGGNHGSRSWRMGLCAEHRDSPLETLRERTAACPVETTAVAHGGSPRMKALPPQDRAASLLPKPRIFGPHTKSCSHTTLIRIAIDSWHTKILSIVIKGF